MHRYLLAVLLSVVALAFGAPAAQAVVVDMNAIGQPTVTYDASSQSGYYGVALMPGVAGGKAVPGTLTGQLANAHIPIVITPTSCTDPALALTPDLAFLPNTNPLCLHPVSNPGYGSVIHANETFALTWDPNRSYWSGTRGFVEQFLRDVADGSGTLTSPYALTTQYTDTTGRAGNTSKYGGSCIDYGNPNNSSNTNTTCLFGSAVQTGPGYNYPSNGCTPTGTSFTFSSTGTNTTCLTDAQIQAELQRVIPQTGMLQHTQPGYTPMVTVLLPPTVEGCLDSAGTLCSANSAATAKFCSYHAQAQMPDGTEVTYVVQPWTAFTACDEPDAPSLPGNPTPQQLATIVGTRLVSPLSRSAIAAIVNPALNGWFALDGSETNDNGCLPLGGGADSVVVGSSSQNPYLLQREFNNAAALENDPNTYFGCAPNVILSPTFVVPSAVDQGEVVGFDGSATAATLLVPNAQYQWDFGDGSSATGPSVVHTYATGGTYTVKLTVTDRGGNHVNVSEPITVLGPNGLPVTPAPTTSTTSGGSGPGGGSTQTPLAPLQVHLLLMPQSLRAALRSGIALRVSANEAADGFAYVSISRAAAKRAGIKLGRAASVQIGRGTVARVSSGTATLRLHLSRGVAAKLKRLKHVTLTVLLSLASSSGDRVVAVAAAHF